VLTDEAEDVERLLGFLGDLVVNISLDVKTVHGAWHADVLMVLVRGKPRFRTSKRTVRVPCCQSMFVSGVYSLVCHCSRQRWSDIVVSETFERELAKEWCRKILRP
jgi:hypothetical protein